MTFFSTIQGQSKVGFNIDYYTNEYYTKVQMARQCQIQLGLLLPWQEIR